MVFLHLFDDLPMITEHIWVLFSIPANGTYPHRLPLGEGRVRGISKGLIPQDFDPCEVKRLQIEVCYLQKLKGKKKEEMRKIEGRR